MDKIRIQGNVKRIEVNDNGDILELDFDDLNLPYAFYGMIKKFKDDRVRFTKELAEKIKDMSDEETADAFVAAERELNIYMRDAIDKVFGRGRAARSMATFCRPWKCTCSFLTRCARISRRKRSGVRKK